MRKNSPRFHQITSNKRSKIKISWGSMPQTPIVCCMLHACCIGGQRSVKMPKRPIIQYWTIPENYHLFVVGVFFLTQIMLCTHKTATILCRYIVLHYRMSHTVILPPPSTALVSQKLSRLMVTSLSMCRTKQMKHCGANQFNVSMENHLNIILLHHHHNTFESRVITSFQPSSVMRVLQLVNWTEHFTHTYWVLARNLLTNGV